MQLNSKAVSNFESPKCAACDFWKGCRQSNKINTIKNNPIKDQDLKNDRIMLGQMLDAYHYILWDPGRLYHINGKTNTYEMFSWGCVFIDHASGYVIINHQVAINATETVK